MIKNYRDITIKDYSKVERTGKIGHLCAWYLPTILVAKKIEKQLEKIAALLNESESDQKKEDLHWKLQSLVKIEAIEINYYGVLNLFHVGMKLNIFKLLLPRRYKRKVNVKDQNLKKYIDNIKKYTGKEIKSLSDIEKIRKDLQFRKDKYNENFNRKSKKQEKVYLMSIALGVFSYLNQSINENLTVIDFLILRNDAYKIQEQKSVNNGRG